MGVELEVQEMLFRALSENEALNQMGVSVFDDVPQGSSFPYITIGEAIFTERGTDTETDFEGTATIHTWSRYAGRAETKRIQGVVFDALNRAPLSLESLTLDELHFESSTSFLDADGKTRHGVQTFRLIVQE